MKKILIVWLAVLLSQGAYAQLIVNDPAGQLQSEMQHFAHMIEQGLHKAQLGFQFEKTKEIFNQGKDWYDGLQKVSRTLKDFRKIKETIAITKEVVAIYSNNLYRFASDKNFSTAEVAAINRGYLKLLAENSRLLDELGMGAHGGELKLTDKERLDIINSVYERIREHKQLVEYYTRKHIQVSYLRAQKSGDTKRVLHLYGLNN